jgi:ribosomal protein S18 acetylase RimI-like enzyme
MEIKNAQISDLDEILRLYELARAYQKERFPVVWPYFESSLVEQEINEKRQWKMVTENAIACIWATTNSDPLIWEARNADPSVYIHRIATNPVFRGGNFVVEIVAWAEKYAIENGLQYVRLDTVGENKKLIDYYQKCGFTFLGLSTLKNTEGLPQHYHNAAVSLFELRVV